MPRDVCSVHLFVTPSYLKGSWTNFQRALQQYRFFPDDWKSFDEKMFRPKVGARREPGFFNMFVRFGVRETKVMLLSPLLPAVRECSVEARRCVGGCRATWGLRQSSDSVSVISLLVLGLLCLVLLLLVVRTPESSRLLADANKLA
jgi:hypothetical protein